MEFISYKIGLYSEPLYIRFLLEIAHPQREDKKAFDDDDVNSARAFCEIVERSDIESDVRLGILSLIHSKISDYYFNSGQVELGHRELNLTIELALASGLHEAIYAAYSCAGYVYGLLGDYKVAAAWYQKTLPYSCDIKPYGVTGVLKTLALVWEFEQETWPLAEAMYDWWLEIAPYSLEAYKNQGEHLAKILGKAALRSLLKSIPKDSCSNIARHVGALSALKSYKAGRKAAALGVELSQKLGDAKWEQAFKSYLSYTSGPAYIKR